MRYVVTVGGRDHVVELSKKTAGSPQTALVDGKPVALDAALLPNGTVNLVMDGKSYDLDFESAGTDTLDARLNVRLCGEVVHLSVEEERRKKLRESSSRGVNKDGPATVLSPMPGKVVKLLKAVGDQVKAGEGVVVVEAMKMENELKAPTSGTVKEIKVKEGQPVESGAVLVVVG